MLVKKITEQKIIRLYKNGESQRAIERILGVNRSLIRKILLKNNVALNKNLAESELAEKVLEIYKNNPHLTQPEIAEILNIDDYSEVSYILKKYNIEYKKIPVRVLESWDNNISIQDISKLYKIEMCYAGWLVAKHRPYSNRIQKMARLVIDNMLGLDYPSNFRFFQKLAKIDNRKHSCEICGKQTKIVIDHNHKSNKIRGLLCDFCNTTLERVEENPKIIKKALQYIKQGKSVKEKRLVVRINN